MGFCHISEGIFISSDHVRIPTQGYSVGGIGGGGLLNRMPNSDSNTLDVQGDSEMRQ